MSYLNTLKARLRFKHASVSPAWLDYNMIKIYQKTFSSPSSYGYDQESTAKRGEERAKTILNLVPSEKIKIFLELGCWDGMTSCALQRKGNTTVAIDKCSKGFDKRAMHEGVLFVKMDAHCLHFKDETFDMVFSYFTFEHFANPEKVLKEIIRVVKTNGFIYLEVGGTHMSPWGAHLYRQITIPYCDVLFHKKSLQKFADSKGLGTLGQIFPTNSYTLEDFRKLWSRYSHQLKCIKYLEVPVLDRSCIKLIEKHPSCFKSKTQNFDNLIVSSIHVLFQKIR